MSLDTHEVQCPFRGRSVQTYQRSVASYRVLWTQLSGATAGRGVPLRVNGRLATKDMAESFSEVILVIPLLEKSDN